ncbi:MAG TPA: hypothetical protein DHV85_23080, partial [Candidatus Accumulibacter sp.]|nr:hypothetical protein [Accumulibacter sp.]
RAALALPASSWGVDAVLAAAAQPEDRRRLINWLLRSEPCDGQTLHVHSLARQALTWWQARYAAADEEKRTHE